MSNINKQTQDLFAIDAVQDLDNESVVTFSGGAGPTTLTSAGANVNFPTWEFGRSTKLWTQSLDPNNFGGDCQW